MLNNYHILLTIDVEDWFQVENFKQCIPFSSWPSYELRVEKNTHRLLNLLDSQRSAISGNPTNSTHSLPKMQIDLCQFHQETDKTIKSNRSRRSSLTTNSPKATFFILGWIAKRLPHIVREIHSRGHEVASHGYYHNLCNHQSLDHLKKDLSDSKKLLEDIIGEPIYGYRAPSFSINNDILKIIEDCGYLYDSSYNSFAIHSRYGQVALSQNGARGIALQIADTRNPEPETQFYELPISNLDLRTPFSFQLSAFSSRRNAKTSSLLTSFALPWGGGVYFRLIPFPLFKLGVESILKRQKAFLFYLHPWEVDPQQPRVNHASRFLKFRHYANLKNTLSKLSSFVEAFNKCRFITCRQYLRSYLPPINQQ